MSLDAFNVIAGLVSIGSLFFSAWIYWKGKRKEAVEIQRLHEYSERLRASYTLTKAAVNQAKLIGALSDREETTTKELKHLTVSLLASLIALNDLISRGIVETKSWSFGVPARYFDLEGTVDKPEQKAVKSAEELQ